MERDVVRYLEIRESHNPASLTKWLTLAVLKAKSLMRIAGNMDIDDQKYWLTITDSYMRIKVEHDIEPSVAISAARNFMNKNTSLFMVAMFKKDENAIYLDFKPLFKELLEKELNGK